MNRLANKLVLWGVAALCLPAHAQTQDTTTTFTYDDLGNIKSVTRPLSRSTTYTYDALGRVQQQSIAITGATLTSGFGYDGLDHLVSVTDPRNLQTTYTVDGLGNKNAQNSPDTASTTYTSDIDGRVVTSTDARGKQTNYSYDALGRLVQVSYASGTSSVFEYDGGPGGPMVEVGQLTRMTDQSGNTTFAHDARGRLLRRTQVVTAAGTGTAQQTSYAYGTSGSALGKLVSMTYPSGTRVSYSYDNAGRVSGVSVSVGDGSGNTNSASDTALVTNIQYTPTGMIQSWSWGNSLGWPAYQRTYDLDGRLTSYPIDSTGTTRSVQYNAANQIVGYTHAGGVNPGQFDQAFEYDLADRLTKVTQGGLVTTYAYDADGNRTQQTGQNGTYTYSTSSNRLTSVVSQTSQAYSYDAAGNVLSDGASAYTYGDNGRLRSAVKGASQAFYFYNGKGERVAKMVNGAATLYTYDEDGRTIGEYAGGQFVEVIYIGSTPLAVVTNSGVFPIFADHLDSPLSVASRDTGVMVWDWRGHDAFGANAPNLVAGGSLPYLNLRFPGQISDAETGLNYNYFRNYDPQTGRYIQSDPIGLRSGVNTYSYVNASPLSAVDTFGLADVNLFSPTKDGPLFGYAQAWGNYSNTFTIAGHGDRNRIYGPGMTYALDATALARMIVANPKYKPGMQIELGSCNAGNVGDNGKSLAQNLADAVAALTHTSTAVIATTRFAWFQPGGTLLYAPAKWNGTAWERSGSFGNYRLTFRSQ